jgi:hypothetical protein
MGVWVVWTGWIGLDWGGRDATGGIAVLLVG